MIKLEYYGRSSGLADTECRFRLEDGTMSRFGEDFSITGARIWTTYLLIWDAGWREWRRPAPEEVAHIKGTVLAWIEQSGSNEHKHFRAVKDLLDFI
jgi:hypothetical protein